MIRRATAADMPRTSRLARLGLLAALAFLVGPLSVDCSRPGGRPPAQLGDESSASQPIDDHGALSKIYFPFEFTIAPGNALVVGSRFFQGGDPVSFAYEDSVQALFVNGLLWTSYAEPIPSEPQNAGEAWAREFIRRFRSTEGEGPQKVRAVFETMDTTNVDMSEPPKFYAQTLFVKLRDIGGTEVDLSSPPSHKLDGPELAFHDIAPIAAQLRQDSPYVYVKDDARRMSYSGTAASEVLRLLGAAQSGTLTETDRASAQEYAISRLLDAMSAVER